MRFYIVPLVALCESSNVNLTNMASSMSWEEARNRLKKLRDDQSRCSREVVELWTGILTYFTDKLGNELWVVYEQVCMAACDCGDILLAKKCIHELDQQFKNSVRVQNLKGLVCEASENYEDAEKIYASILEDDPANGLAEKRIVCIYKARNKIEEAITSLNKYLKNHMADTDSWLELCDLYLSQMNYSHAAFCMEELILGNPHNHLFHQRYAEIKYTQGGTENLLESRTYFAQAVKLNPVSIRALYGLFLVSTHLATKQKSEQKNIKYAAWAAEQIASKYRELDSDVEKEGARMKSLEGLLGKLQITNFPS